GKLTADVVTLSRRDDPAYSHREAVSGDPFFLDAPGEYEVRGILVTGLATRGPNETRNIVFIVELEGLRIAHLGLITPDSARKLDELKGVDILLLPVGGGGSLNAAMASDVMTTIDPNLVIPMHYRTEEDAIESLDPLDRFLKETGSKPEPEARITVSKVQLPSELTVRVL